MKISDKQILSKLTKDDGIEPYAQFDPSDYRVHFSKSEVLRFARELIALAQEVELLQWSDSEHYPKAIIGDDDDLSYAVFCDTYGDGKWYLDLPDESTIGKFRTMDEAKEAANEHNTKRVLSQLKYGGVE